MNQLRLGDAYPLLVHELMVRAVVDNISSKNRSGEMSVSLFGRDLRELAIEDKVISFGSQVHGHFPAKQDKGENIPILERNKKWLRISRRDIYRN